MLDQPIVLGDYQKTSRVQLGLKLVNAREGLDHPIALRMIDTPGYIGNLRKAAQFAFEKPNIILIFFDSSMKLDEQSIRDWTFFTLSQVYTFHSHAALLKQ